MSRLLIEATHTNSCIFSTRSSITEYIVNCSICMDTKDGELWVALCSVFAISMFVCGMQLCLLEPRLHGGITVFHSLKHRGRFK